MKNTGFFTVVDRDDNPVLNEHGSMLIDSKDEDLKGFVFMANAAPNSLGQGRAPYRVVPLFFMGKEAFKGKELHLPPLGDMAMKNGGIVHIHPLHSLGFSVADKEMMLNGWTAEEDPQKAIENAEFWNRHDASMAPHYAVEVFIQKIEKATVQKVEGGKD